MLPHIITKSAWNSLALVELADTFYKICHPKKNCKCSLWCSMLVLCRTELHIKRNVQVTQQSSKLYFRLLMHSMKHKFACDNRNSNAIGISCNNNNNNNSDDNNKISYNGWKLQRFLLLLSLDKMLLYCIPLVNGKLSMLFSMIAVSLFLKCFQFLLLQFGPLHFCFCSHRSFLSS